MCSYYCPSSSAGEARLNGELGEGKLIFSCAHSLVQLPAEPNKLLTAARAQVAWIDEKGGRDHPTHPLSTQLWLE